MAKYRGGFGLVQSKGSFISLVLEEEDLFGRKCCYHKSELFFSYCPIGETDSLQFSFC